MQSCRHAPAKYDPYSFCDDRFWTQKSLGEKQSSLARHSSYRREHSHEKSPVWIKADQKSFAFSRSCFFPRFPGVLGNGGSDERSAVADAAFRIPKSTRKVRRPPPLRCRPSQAFIRKLEQSRELLQTLREPERRRILRIPGPLGESRP